MWNLCGYQENVSLCKMFSIFHSHRQISTSVDHQEACQTNPKPIWHHSFWIILNPYSPHIEYVLHFNFFRIPAKNSQKPFFKRPTGLLLVFLVSTSFRCFLFFSGKSLAPFFHTTKSRRKNDPRLLHVGMSAEAPSSCRDGTRNQPRSATGSWLIAANTSLSLQRKREIVKSGNLKKS